MLHREFMAAMADENGLYNYDSVHSDGRLKQEPFKADLFVCCILNNAMQGIKFLSL